jgi:vacuolar-type H+-ATPase subunit F/Vma7
MIAMGERPLMEGFALLGFETWPDADTEDLKQVLSELVQSGQKALVLLETYLSRSSCPLLADIRNHGGNIIVTEVPAINAAKEYHPFVEDLVVKVLGKQA